MPTTYAVLLQGDENLWESLPEAEQTAVFARHEAFATALAERGHTITGGAELTHSRRTTQVRLVDGAAVVTEGPYVESVEQLGGLYLVESDDLADLVECVKLLVDGDGAIEIRPATDG